jgi:hypothetical protein
MAECRGLNSADAVPLHYNGNAIDLRRYRTVTMDYLHIQSQLNQAGTASWRMAGIPGEAETSRNEHHAWTAACLCRSIRAPLPTTFEGRRRTWPEIGDRLSRFAGVGAHRIGHGDRIAVLMLKPGSLHRLLPDRQLGGHRDRAPQYPLEYPGWGSSICAHTAGVEPDDSVDSRAHRSEKSAGRDISADDPG